MQFFFTGLILTFLSALALASAPCVVEWNTTNFYGPDGPWQVVSVGVGSDGSGNPLSTVNLSPGGIYESMIPTVQLCQGSSPICFAASAGLYDIEESTTLTTTNSPGLVWQWGSSAAINTTGTAVEVTDTISMSTGQGVLKVPNSVISAINQQSIYLPDSANYQVLLGSLSLGAPGNGTQLLKTGVGRNFPSYLATQNITSSNSFSLHYGSASLGLEGSLVWGGYDQNRAIGYVGSFELFQEKMMVPTLLDVQIGVENGESPFINGSSFTGLLELNSTLNNVQPTIINPIVPYFFMSPGTCAAIAKQLPVTLHSDIGLYIWNVTDPQFRRIVNSPAYLALIFESSPDANLTIKVPFQLLNLTLEPPIVANSQQYFPCKPFNSMDGKGNYYLGKAFLQAALVGVNWETGTYFMAQAPGPNVPSAIIQAIGPSDTSVASVPIENFEKSWSNSWTSLTNQSNGTTTPGPPSENPSTPYSNSTTSVPRPLSLGTKLGLGFGGAIGFVALTVAIVALVHRQRKLRRLKKMTPVPRAREPHESDSHAVHEKSSNCLPHEMDASTGLHEKYSHNVYEKGPE